MSNPTSNFGWQMPEPTDLVTNLPADFEVFGQAVDTDFVDLLGGTTGQVLAKASNADLDFVWSADAAGMTNPMTTTGDIIYGSSGSTPGRIGIGSTGNVLTVAAGIPSWSAPSSGASYAIFRDFKSGNASGGTFTSGAWRTRDLQTTVVNNITGCSLASNQITLASGTYYINATAPGRSVDNHQTRLYNTTDGAELGFGTDAYVQATVNASGNSPLQTYFTISAQKVIELQHRCVTTRADDGFGQNNGFGTETYAVITIVKVG
jgi:hypothetical protein